MTKSSDFDFVGLYAAMLKDVAAYLPNDQIEWDRDLSRITLLMESRGDSVFTIDFPKLGKALDASLSKGRLILDGLNHSGSRHPGSKIPRLFWGLWSRIFDSDGCLKHDIDANHVFFLRSLLYAFKGFRYDEHIPRYLYETVKEFYDVDSALPEAPDLWSEAAGFVSRRNLGSLHDYRDSDPDVRTLFSTREPARCADVLHFVQQFADRVAGEIGFVEPEALQFRHGPGAVSDLSKGGYKYSFPNWNPRLEVSFPYDRFGTSSGSYDEIESTDGYGIRFDEPCSNLIAVPKGRTGPRLIASEPTCNQWIQQGVRNFLYAYVERRGTLLSSSITFRSQEPSRDMALSASRDGSFATVDLKSASDRLSAYLVQRMFRANLSLLNALSACRTRFIRQRKGTPEYDSKSPDLWRLRKFSTQGSALTFPVQSIVFAIICVGVGRYLSPSSTWRALSRQVRVFGDDIIIPKSWEPQVRLVLHQLGLRVNDTKTHSEGNFRESCGMDAYGGYDVTPAHVLCVPDKSKPRSVASTVEASNNFHMKGMWNVSSFLASTISSQNILTRSPHNGLFGLVSFSGTQIPSRKRWNKDLHCWEAFTLQIFAKPKVSRKDTSANLLQFFTEFPGNHQDPQWYWRSALFPLREFKSGVITGGTPVFRGAWVSLDALAA